MADFQKLKATMAKVDAVIGKEPKTTIETTTETTTRADLEDVPEYPLNED